MSLRLCLCLFSLMLVSMAWATQAAQQLSAAQIDQWVACYQQVRQHRTAGLGPAECIEREFGGSAGFNQRGDAVMSHYRIWAGAQAHEELTDSLPKVAEILRDKADSQASKQQVDELMAQAARLLEDPVTRKLMWLPEAVAEAVARHQGVLSDLAARQASAMRKQ